MDVAVGPALFALPYFYITTLAAIAKPSALVFALSAWTGLIGLFIGIVWGAVKKQTALCWFAVSPLLSHVISAIALSFSRQLDSHETTW